MKLNLTMPGNDQRGHAKLSPGERLAHEITLGGSFLQGSAAVAALAAQARSYVDALTRQAGGPHEPSAAQ